MQRMTVWSVDCSEALLFVAFWIESEVDDHADGFDSWS